MRSTTQWSLKLAAVGALALVMLVTMAGMAFANGGKRDGSASGSQYGPSGNQYGPSGNQYGPSGKQYGPSGDQYGNQYGRFGKVNVCVVKRHGRVKMLTLPAWAAKWYLRHHRRAFICRRDDSEGRWKWKHEMFQSKGDKRDYHDH